MWGASSNGAPRRVAGVDIMLLWSWGTARRWLPTFHSQNRRLSWRRLCRHWWGLEPRRAWTLARDHRSRCKRTRVFGHAEFI